MPSFDVVCKVNEQEVVNAVNNATKEIVNRYDFRNTDTELEWNTEASTLTLESNAEGRVVAAWDVLQSHLVRRKVSLEGMELGEIKEVHGGRSRQEVAVQQGIPRDVAKKIVKLVKDTKLKVQGSIQGDTVRFSGKKRDALQEAIATIKAADLGLPLSYVNFRD